MTHDIDVSVVVATYNSDIKKEISTIRSVIDQKGIRFEIIVADDGSLNNNKELIENYLQESKISDYSLLMHETNEGTIKNITDALKKSRGRYIKLISPGDLLYGDYALKNWIDYLEREGAQWSFCDCIYYHMNNDEKVVDKARRHPMVLRPYRQRDLQRCRWNVVVLADCILGAATLCKRDILIDYVSRLVDRTRYSEDYAYRLMMWDGIVPVYYPVCAMLYEYGTGISSSTNVSWIRTLQKEWETVTEIILEEEPDNDIFKQRMRRSVIIANRFKKLHIIYRVVWRYFNVLFEPEKNTLGYLP